MFLIHMGKKRIFSSQLNEQKEPRPFLTDDKNETTWSRSNWGDNTMTTRAEKTSNTTPFSPPSLSLSLI